MKIVVLKFGGTSVGSIDRIKKVCKIIASYKKKKNKEYTLFTNVVFDNEKEADEFGRKSMRRGFEHKIVEYDSENYERYWK